LFNWIQPFKNFPHLGWFGISLAPYSTELRKWRMKMRTSKKYSFTIVDALVGLAIVLVLSGLVVPYFVKPSSTTAAAPLTHVSAPK